MPVNTENTQNQPLISVVIPCCNQGHYLGEAIESVLRQEYSPFEIVVVDDGSTDHTASVAARYPTVHYTYQANAGLSASRNQGIRSSHGHYLLFLDADDRLCEGALQAGRNCLEAHPGCGFVYGAFRFMDEKGEPLVHFDSPPDNADDYQGLFRGNHVAMCATVLYPRTILEQVGGFDERLRAAEDYDLYFRIARRYPFFRHGAVMAECRRHTRNMSRDAALMLRSTLTVIKKQRPYIGEQEQNRLAYRDSLHLWRQYYGSLLVRQIRENIFQRDVLRTARDVLTLLTDAPAVLRRSIFRAGGKASRVLTRRLVPPPVLVHSRRLLRAPALRRLTPLSRDFGYDRGTPVDRYYIERALAGYAADIRGHILEIKDNSYTVQFGSRKVVQSDVLDISPDNPQATVVADLANASELDGAVYDCIIVTQTLQLIYDLAAAVRTLYRLLKPGGVLLVTVPGISQIARTQTNSWWDHWRFTSASVARLFGEVFGAQNIQVNVQGNLCAAVSFLQGRAAEELSRQELDFIDQDYQLIISVRAVKKASQDLAGRTHGGGGV